MKIFGDHEIIVALTCGFFKTAPPNKCVQVRVFWIDFGSYSALYTRSGGFEMSNNCGWLLHKKKLKI